MSPDVVTYPLRIEIAQQITITLDDQKLFI